MGDLGRSRWLPERRANRGRAIEDFPVWDRTDMRRALAERDIAMVYRLLQRHGVSQRQIARATEQSQSEISEVLTGGRRIGSYDLLLRIADGLSVPRGRMGLAYDEGTATLLKTIGVAVVETGEERGDPPLWKIYEWLGDE